MLVVRRDPAPDSAPAPSAADRGDRRARGDRGASTSLAVATLSPLFVALSFAAFQAALWSHARTEARIVARDTAALVARSGVGADDAAAAARRVLATDTPLTDIDVRVAMADGIAVVTVTADAPGILRGTSRRVDVTVAVPIEQVIAP